MASLTRWPWVWVKSGSWWWTGKPGVLWFMGSQRVGHNWATELNWTECVYRPCMYLLWRNIHSSHVLILKIVLLVFLWLSCSSSFYILNIRPSSDATFANILPFCWLSFYLPDVLWRAKLFNFDEIKCIFFHLSFYFSFVPSFSI